jgi:hypothetical protein
MVAQGPRTAGRPAAASYAAAIEAFRSAIEALRRTRGQATRSSLTRSDPCWTRLDRATRQRASTLARGSAAFVDRARALSPRMTRSYAW